jgi:hypothetical protein
VFGECILAQTDSLSALCEEIAPPLLHRCLISALLPRGYLQLSEPYGVSRRRGNDSIEFSCRELRAVSIGFEVLGWVTVWVYALIARSVDHEVRDC